MSGRSKLVNTEKCKHCGHPMRAHTDSLDTIPYSVCARFVLVADAGGENYVPCECQLLAGVNE